MAATAGNSQLPLTSASLLPYLTEATILVECHVPLLIHVVYDVTSLPTQGRESIAYVTTVELQLWPMAKILTQSVTP